MILPDLLERRRSPRRVAQAYAKRTTPGLPSALTARAGIQAQSRSESGSRAVPKHTKTAAGGEQTGGRGAGV